MKKGFTLIEMIAVVGIIGLMSIIVMPTIINQVANKKEDLSDATKKVIFSATELYMNDNINDYPNKPSNIYCIKLQTLVKSGYLKSPLKDVTTNKNIDTSKLVKVMVNEYGEYDNFKMLEKDESCS